MQHSRNIRIIKVLNVVNIFPSSLSQPPDCGDESYKYPQPPLSLGSSVSESPYHDFYMSAIQVLSLLSIINLSIIHSN